MPKRTPLVSSVVELEAELRRQGGYVVQTNLPRGPIYVVNDRQCSPTVLARAIEHGRLRPSTDGLFNGEPSQSWTLASR